MSWFLRSKPNFHYGQRLNIIKLLSKAKYALKENRTRQMSGLGWAGKDFDVVCLHTRVNTSMICFRSRTVHIGFVVVPTKGCAFPFECVSKQFISSMWITFIWEFSQSETDLALFSGHNLVLKTNTVESMCVVIRWYLKLKITRSLMLFVLRSVGRQHDTSYKSRFADVD